MTLDDLRTFVSVCEAASLSAVAREIGRTQPAVSQHIARLETEMGIALFERRPRGVAMTEAGRVLYEAVRDGLDRIDVAVRELELLREGERGSLGISTGGTTVRHFMQASVVRFRERYPAIHLGFQSANSTRRCVEALRTEAADLAFITMMDPIRGVEQKPVVAMPWVLVVRTSDKLARRRSIPATGLADLDLIGLPDRSASQIQLEEAMAERGLELSTAMGVDDWDTAILLAGLGLGKAIAPALHGVNLAEEHGVTTIPIKGVPPVTFGWATRRWKSLGGPARDFVELFREEMASREGVPGLRVLDEDGQ